MFLLGLLHGRGWQPPALGSSDPLSLARSCSERLKAEMDERVLVVAFAWSCGERRRFQLLRLHYLVLYLEFCQQ